VDQGAAVGHIERFENYHHICDAILEGNARRAELAGRQSETAVNPAMEHLIAWLPVYTPTDDMTRLAPRDYRLDDIILHPVKRPESWEFYTILSMFRAVRSKAPAGRCERRSARRPGVVDLKRRTFG
jgi:hypothetical protein